MPRRTLSLIMAVALTLALVGTARAETPGGQATEASLWSEVWETVVQAFEDIVGVEQPAPTAQETTAPPSSDPDYGPDMDPHG